MGQVTRPFEYIPGEVIFASILTSNETTLYDEFNGNIDDANIKLTASINQLKINDISGSVSAMRTQVDPGEVGSENQASSLKEEIEELRFAITGFKKLFKASVNYWYEPIAASAQLTGLEFGILDLRTASFAYFTGTTRVTGSLRVGATVNKGIDLSDDNTNSILAPGSGRGTGSFLIKSTDGTTAITIAQNGSVSIPVLALSLPSVKAYRTAVLSLVASTWTTVAFAFEDFDTDTMHDLVTNNSRITITTPGIYRFTGAASGSGDGGDTDNFRLRFIVNGSTISRNGQYNTYWGGAGTRYYSESFNLAQNDYVEMQVQSGESGNLSIPSGTDFTAVAVFSAERVG